MYDSAINKYFNQDFKVQYLLDNQSRNIFLKSNVDLLFRRIAPIETQLGKDLYDFSVEEILGYYKYLLTPSLESLMVMNNQYKLYVAYAIRKGVVKDNQNHYDEIDMPTLNTCVYVGLANAKIINRQTLIDILESSDVENISDRVIALALFEGVCGKELSELTMLEPTDINEKTKIAKLYGGRELELSEKLVNWCMESAQEYVYYNSMNKMGNKSYIQTDSRVIKRLSNSTVDTINQRNKTINRRLDHLIDITGCNAFGVGALKESGRLEMIKNLRESGLSLDLALRDKNMLYRYGRITSLKRYILKYGLT